MFKISQSANFTQSYESIIFLKTPSKNEKALKEFLKQMLTMLTLLDPSAYKFYCQFFQLNPLKEVL